MIYLREQQEQFEDQTLAPYALRSAASEGREFPESESTTRTAFQRDRDRIIHTTAFRRLEYKTQVFVNYEGDHYRTRLTHTLEVAQLGRSLARGLGVNEVLTEAICLAHDLGHSPFGHAGEHILDKLMVDHGGFNHNTQSFRIVTELEQRYAAFHGLNLSYETREGIIKHETAYDKSDWGSYAPDKRASLEAQIANMADEMAYNAHDLEDGLRSGLLPIDELDELEIWQQLRDYAGWQSGPLEQMTRHAMIRELIGVTVTDVIKTTAARLEAAGIDSAEKVQRHDNNLVFYSDDLAPKIAALKKFLYDRLYKHYRLVRMQVKAENFLSAIFEAYVKQPKMLPTETYALIESRGKHRAIADYIAGMTDRYALDEYEKLFNPYTRA